MVSDNGDVKSLRTGKTLKPAFDKCGYKYYILCVNGVRITAKGHRLVAMAFIPNPDMKPSIDHINGIKTDNRSINLRWVTNKENSHNPITYSKLQRVARDNYPKLYAKAVENDFGRKSVTVYWDDGRISQYRSLKEAANALNENYSKLSEKINGKRPQNRNYRAVWSGATK